MCRLQCLLTFIALSINLVNAWDIAITNGDHLEFYTNGTKTSNEGTGFTHLTAMAYDAVHNMLLFVDNDKQSDNASIYSYKLATKKYDLLVRKKVFNEILDIAIDPITSMLFWTENSERSIFWVSLAPGSNNNANGNLLIKMDNAAPAGIAVDSCRGYIYWTNPNINSKIERARFNGTDRQTIISHINDDNLYMPLAIAIDQQSKRLYWADYNAIMSSDLEGHDIKTEMQGDVNHHIYLPSAVTLSKDSIFWLDRSIFWNLPKKHKKDELPKELVRSKIELLYGLVANYNINDQTKNILECRPLGDIALNLAQKETTFLYNLIK